MIAWPVLLAAFVWVFRGELKALMTRVSKATFRGAELTFRETQSGGPAAALALRAALVPLGEDQIFSWLDRVHKIEVGDQLPNPNDWTIAEQMEVLRPFVELNVTMALRQIGLEGAKPTRFVEASHPLLGKFISPATVSFQAIVDAESRLTLLLVVYITDDGMSITAANSQILAALAFCELVIGDSRRWTLVATLCSTMTDELRFEKVVEDAREYYKPSLVAGTLQLITLNPKPEFCEKLMVEGANRIKVMRAIASASDSA